MNLKTEEIRKAAAYFTDEIKQLADRPLRIMEVCGTHTVAIFRAGIRQVLPENVELVRNSAASLLYTPPPLPPAELLANVQLVKTDS